MKNSRYILANVVIELDVDKVSDLSGLDLTSYVNSRLLRLGSDERIECLNAYLLAAKPAPRSDGVVEEYIYRGFQIKIEKDADMLGTGRPTYYALVFNPNVVGAGSVPLGIGSESIGEAKKAAELRADKRIETLKKQGKSLSEKEV